jgi:hypothetical protein
VPKKKTALQYIIELQTIHACNTHAGSYCVVQASGNHYQLTKQDLSLWALLIVGHSYSFLQIVLLIMMQSEGVHHKLTEVPHQIRMDDAKPNTH